MIKCAFFDILSTFLIAIPCFSKSRASSVNKIGSSTTPLPITFTWWFWKMPDGMERSTTFLPSNTRVWPAFGPPWNRATTSYRGVSTSTTFPFPSSPHCKPKRTSTFIIDLCYLIFLVFFFIFRAQELHTPFTQSMRYCSLKAV